MSISLALFLTFAIGVVAGLRSMTAPAAAAWAARRHYLNVAGTALSFMASTITLIVFLVFAAGELIADKLPNTPARTKPAGLGARILTGALSGACVGVTIGLSILPGALLGAAGGIAGAFAGYQWRTGLVHALKLPDYAVALLEDAVAISAVLYIVSRF